MEGDVALLSSLVMKEREIAMDLEMVANMTAMLDVKEISSVEATTVFSLVCTITLRMTAVRGRRLPSL